ncbi:hypothetical protein CHF27_011210 [Romboutsia maritimum]|uniref:HK97 gp10 family phage protein n=1 Tax=Romboutsia maritimum TaxID=2020948 RepID=A0A371IQW5_9FIRM|nr:hypothetical protein [Romboutsia maritimum]RDY22880.1 hypothetical protein CHF27_011210 [Romboutsia maritimum]
MGFRFDGAQLFRNLAEQQIKTRAALGLFADTSAKTLENEAKNNHPWEDRTYQARNRLKGDYEWQGNLLRISLSHGVDYGIYLELCNEGKYAVITPTINKCSPKIMRGLDRILK